MYDSMLLNFSAEARECLYKHSLIIRKGMHDIKSRIPLVLVHPAKPYNNLNQTYVGTIKNSVMLPRNAVSLVQSRKSLGQQPLVVTGAAGHKHPSRLCYVKDHTTGLPFIVDTSAEVSVVPPTPTDHLHKQTGPSLQVVNNTTIVTYCTCSLTLNLGLRQTFCWIFVIANIRKPILGADFLSHYELIVDVARRKLSHAVTQLTVQGVVSTEPSVSPSLLPRQVHNLYLIILHDFPSLLKP